MSVFLLTLENSQVPYKYKLKKSFATLTQIFHKEIHCQLQQLHKLQQNSVLAEELVLYMTEITKGKSAIECSYSWTGI